VRDYLAEAKGSAWVELTVGREMVERQHEDGAGGGGLVARCRHEAEERKGGVRLRGRRRRKMGGGGNGDVAVMGRPFKRARWGGEGGTVHGRCVGASTEVGRRGVADNGPVAALTGYACSGGGRPAPKQGRRGTAKWGPGIVTGGRI
jgi:hypothetical protein